MLASIENETADGNHAIVVSNARANSLEGRVCGGQSLCLLGDRSCPSA